MIAVAGGVIITVLFIAALAAGGKSGQTIAVDTGKVYLPYSIKIASVGVMSSLLLFYLGNTHELSLETEQKNKPVKKDGPGNARLIRRKIERIGSTFRSFLFYLFSSYKTYFHSTTGLIIQAV